jgi:hypothetical protein
MLESFPRGTPKTRQESAAKIAKMSTEEIDKRLGLDPAMGGQGPSAKWKNLKTEPLSEGLDDYAWFKNLPPEQKDEVVRHVMVNTNMLKLKEHGGPGYGIFVNLIFSLIASGAPHAGEIFVELASQVTGADSTEALETKFQEMTENASGDIPVDHLLRYAETAGVDLSPWNGRAEAKERIKEKAKETGETPKEENQPSKLDQVMDGFFGGDKAAGKQDKPLPHYPPTTLDEVHAVFKKWLGNDYDTDATDAVLAAAAAEKLTGDPLWLLLISGPGNAKTEMVQSLAGAGAQVTSTITSEGALLSATSRRQRAKTATGGLLRKLGDRGVLVIKDVTSILSADRNVRGGVLAAIREIYDGRWERNVGTDGGQTLTWTGRLAIVGAVTTAWDAAHSVIAAMGDRFVLIRVDSREGREGHGRQAIRNTGQETQMRKELAAAVGGIINHVNTDNVYQPTEEDIDRLVKLADVVTLARTAVERDYQGEIIDAHAPEAPTRFAKQLVQLIRGGTAIGMTPEAAMRLATRCARDSIPPLRLEILADVAANPDTRPGDVRKHVGRPWRTVKREMESLYMLRLLECTESEIKKQDGSIKNDWRYSLDPDIDRDTLLTMRPGGWDKRPKLKWVPKSEPTEERVPKSEPTPEPEPTPEQAKFEAEVAAAAAGAAT